MAALRHTPELKLIYVSLTDRVQHAAAPGEALADQFFIEFDRLLGDYLDAGCLVAITADHGMNSKHDATGEARVIHLEDILRDAGIAFDEIVLPIIDPYTKHHGALGSFAWIYLADIDRERARRALTAVPGIEEVWDREASATIYEHPFDRIGDLAVTAAADTALGRTASAHDLTQLHAALRSHGGRYEQLVPLIISEPVTGPLAECYAANVLRSRDIHDLVLNNTRSGGFRREVVAGRTTGRHGGWGAVPIRPTVQDQ
ncbi:alkaline phosphatase family protein [Plantibacter sp. VKM Ac-2880]|uniref:alkaline phosphatase family protein n=1 Tax=Plantibacter sp. VKM Ac-2880 TaxID=2783827 RepID=UPI001E3DEBCB